MAKICDCNASLSNTGKPDCQPLAQVAKKPIFVRMTKDGGAANEIDCTSFTFNQASFDALVNESDRSAAWYPAADVDNVEDIRGDATFETLNSGKNIRVQDGVRTFAGVMVKQSPEYMKKLLDLRCQKIGVYWVDSSGNLIGNGATADKLKPIRIDNDTLDIKLEKATDSSVQKVMINFEYHRNEGDEDLKMILSTELGGADLLDLNGLLDVNGEVTAGPTTTSFSMKLTSDFGSKVNPLLVEGLLLADFELFNETTSSTVAISTVTESADGVYDFTLPAQLSGNELELRILKDGFDDTNLKTVAITIP